MHTCVSVRGVVPFSFPLSLFYRVSFFVLHVLICTLVSFLCSLVGHSYASEFALCYFFFFRYIACYHCYWFCSYNHSAFNAVAIIHLFHHNTFDHICFVHFKRLICLSMKTKSFALLSVYWFFTDCGSRVAKAIIFPFLHFSLFYLLSLFSVLTAHCIILHICIMMLHLVSYLVYDYQLTCVKTVNPSNGLLLACLGHLHFICNVSCSLKLYNLYVMGVWFKCSHVWDIVHLIKF